MRVAFVLAFIAATGATGVAVAIALPDAGLPVLASAPEPVLVLEPQALAPAELAAPDAPVETPALEPVSLRASALTLPAPVAAVPRHLLLPDGALVSTLLPERSAPQGDGIILPPSLAPADAAAPFVVPSVLDRRFETPGFPWEVAPPATPAPVAPHAERAFVPPAAAGGADPTVLWSGGLVLGAATVLGVVLYHRIRPHAALENETRKLIFDAVCATPGLGVHEISKVAGVSYSTATYHLERLIAAGMIVMTPDGNKLCYYKNGGAFSESERRILPLLKNEEAAKLFEAILAQPGTYRAALAEQLGVTATTINWHLRRLREAGLVDETRAGRSAHLFARVDALRPTFLALASKVEPSEPSIAEKLRAYAVRGESAGVGAA